MTIKLKLCDNGKTPTKAHESDACFDCYSAETIELAPKERQLVKLGFCVGLPEGWEAQIRPRSGMSKKGIDVKLGTIDCGYTGEVRAIVGNDTNEPFLINFGDRICQLSVQKVYPVTFDMVESLEESERGAGGFGSTGV